MKRLFQPKFIINIKTNLKKSLPQKTILMYCSQIIYGNLFFQLSCPFKYFT